MPRPKGTNNRTYTTELKKLVIDYLKINGLVETKKTF
jgi:hypothetical protein